jgi:hypothetical protein
MDMISAGEQQLIIWLREHQHRPTEFFDPSTEAEELEATVAKTLNKLRFNAKTGRVSEVVIGELNEVRAFMDSRACHTLIENPLNPSMPQVC